MKRRLASALCLALASCYAPQRDCQRFHDGTYRFSAEIDGKLQTTTFTRRGELEVSEFNGQTDSAAVRWINDCEYILTNLHPKTRAEEKPLHLKILSTTENSYTFEYKLVGTTRATRGTAEKVQ